jgi:hypothetical protein
MQGEKKAQEGLKIEVTTVSEEILKDGGYDVRFKFALSKPAPEDGYLVQKITVEYESGKIKRKDVYWEAWFVKKGAKVDTLDGRWGDDWTDKSGAGPHAAQNGKEIASGEIKFFPKKKTGNLGDPGFEFKVNSIARSAAGIIVIAAETPHVKPDPKTGWGNEIDAAGILPSTKKEPEWWNTPGVPTAERKVVSVWNALGTKITVTPPIRKLPPP